VGTSVCGVRRAMAYVDVKNIVVLDNPAPFLAPFRFEITFDCTGPLADGTRCAWGTDCLGRCRWAAVTTAAPRRTPLCSGI
jgi:hypothetical protein